MTSAPPPPPDVWDALPVGARTFIEAMWLQVEAMQRRIEALQRAVRSPQAQLASNSLNSSRPPSADTIHLKRQPTKAPPARGGGW